MPHVVIKYTYMDDVDIFLTESVPDLKRFKQISFYNIPYSTIICKNTTRLTGVMLADTEKFYTQSLINAQSKLDPSGENDELILYNLVKEASLRLPIDKSGTHEVIFNSNYRPLHGVHLSFNRGPGKRLCQVKSTRIRQLLLSVKNVGDFFCHDKPGYDLMSKVMKKNYIQEQGNMTVKEGLCQS